MNQNKFSLLARFRSFRHAIAGLGVLLREEHNARVHVLTAVFVIGLGVFFRVNNIEWCLLIFAIGFVIGAELINSSLENICDLVTLEKNTFVKKAKDLAAAAVLISAITAALVGLFIFVPKIVAMFQTCPGGY